MGGHDPSDYMLFSNKVFENFNVFCRMFERFIEINIVSQAINSST